MNRFSKKKPTDKNTDRHLLQPFSMENFMNYLHRFDVDKNMNELFPDENQRFKIAVGLFEEKWKDAQVTVKLLSGDRFFIL